ncbi:MAG: hypothetical protein II946_00035 [Kiritimatiellae bacterium]|nr:hypothetical protein [Kiritimatiellia bacterium]
MNVELNAATHGINWESLLSSLGQVEKADGVDGKQNFTITMNVNGEVQTLTIGVPDDLEIPETVDQGTLNGLVDKLKAMDIGFTDEQIATMKDSIAQIYRNFEAATTQYASKSTGKVLFDLYALMSLMIDVAQSQRDAAREMRMAENLAIQKAIQNQADDQRAAANLGLIVGVTCGLISAAASIGLMAWQGVTAKTQSKIMTQSGADAAKLHSQALQNTDSPQNAQIKLAEVQNKVGGQISNEVTAEFTRQIETGAAGNLRANLDEAMAANTAAKTDATNKATLLQEAKDMAAARTQASGIAENVHNQKVQAVEAKANEVQAKTETVNQKQEAYNQAVANKAGDEAIGAAKAELDTAKAELETAKAQLDTAKAEADTAKAQLDTAKQAVTDQNAKVDQAQRDLGLANDKVTETETALSKAKSDYVKTVQDVAAQYEEKYQAAVERLNNPPAGADKAQLKADVAAAKSKMEMAYALEAKLLSDPGVMSPTEQKNLVAFARERLDVTTDRATRRTDFKAAERKMTMLAGINNINQSMAQVTQSMSSNLAATRSAEATRQGADSKKEEEMLDQTKDLYAQEQKLIDQAIQLFSQVIQTENQSMRDAIQA